MAAVTGAPFPQEISRIVWESKYRAPGEADIRETWRRVAQAVASVEVEPALWQDRFLDLLADFKFLPGGRILAGAGIRRQVTLFNCFAMGPMEDSLDGIFEALKEGALTMQQGGGVGYDFSTLRPRGTRAESAGTVASGPVSFMHIFDVGCAVLLSTGSRRGAMMATLRCDHPDVEEFVEAKRDPQVLRNFNLSVTVSDAFMAAVEQDSDWPLVFPAEQLTPGCGEGSVLRDWPGYDKPVPCRILKTVRARQLWDRIMHATYEVAEPGVLFLDRINRLNNLHYCERIHTTNPCSELPLPPYGACDLGSINLVRFVREPFSDRARLDLDAIAALVPVAVRFLDDVIDLSGFPLEKQRRRARATRRIGLGLTGLADTLIFLGLHYDSDAARRLAEKVMATICHAAYRASIALAREKGAFPLFEPRVYPQGPFVARLPQDIRDGIAAHGLRNSHLLAIAPTGSISLLAGNVSSGLEPVFAWRYQRRLQLGGRECRLVEVTDPAWSLWRRRYGDGALPDFFVTATELSPEAHLAMQAVLQRHVDSAISKTIHIPEDYPFEAFRDVYHRAYELGLKGCTTYRPNPVRGSVLVTERHCCDIDREGD
ncbi:ribonucleoside-diphosphate reductase alpha chain [Methylomarinovum caldicuralii]|uniref:Vitamin B12-dependent ribonucleotide reductase n=1 Tax=Methylomarinovum caldicuralii TaxID=438856 RepID=A0AAU9CMT7_9GAMM|nr:adenosylcobalamin-dependent ribonucleoside-diphosphate reductase [Methylomarinovum caldicuralii]BCX81218.1 ribonucleoside-diphosphate reductase alpha chain [Methylomarinovum caldicuralii]